MAGKLTGGLVNYYLAPVHHPQRLDQAPYVAECEDIAEALQLTPNEFCEFKAIWRTASARLGNGKPDQKALYDAEKRLHYAGRDVAKYKRELDNQPDADGWVFSTSGFAPSELALTDVVQVFLKDGSTSTVGRPVSEWNWSKASESSAIVKYRKV